MPSRHTSACGFLLLAASFWAPAQESANRFPALKSALGLSDTQVSQLQHLPPPATQKTAPVRPGAVAIYSPRPRMPIQSAANEDALRILDDSQRDKLAAIDKLLDRWDEAAVTVGLGLIEEKQWPGGVVCVIYPLRAYTSLAYASELGLTPSQVDQFERMQSRPPHDLALAVLDDPQRAKIAALEATLQAASEAIELKLIPAPQRGEPLCH
jgi:hypothetical protein